MTTGLGREHIDARRAVPPPGRVELGAAVAALFGARMTAGPEPAVYRPNRAERRRRAKQARRG